MKHSQATDVATRELAFQRLLMTSAAYRAAFDARVRVLMASNWVDPDGMAAISAETLPHGSDAALLALPQFAATHTEGK